MFLLFWMTFSLTESFVVTRPSHEWSTPTTTTVLFGRSTPNSGKDRSKRQERVGHLVRTELASIIHRGIIKGDAVYLEDSLRQRISVVSADVSPDLRQARISVSVRPSTNAEDNATVDKRRAFSWLVDSTKALKHTLAQRMSHMKNCPNLTFVQVDVAAATDVMYLIDKISKGYKRESVELDVPQGVVDGLDFDADFDDEDWMEEDDDDDVDLSFDENDEEEDDNDEE